MHTAIIGEKKTEVENAPMQHAPYPGVSIIIPIYNAALYLSRCLDSLLSQSVHEWEAILVDDGSTDESGKLIDSYAAKDARFVAIHQVNGGVSNARNKGIDAARGDYVIFVDADDWVEADFLGSLLRVAAHGVADYVASGYRSHYRHSDVDNDLGRVGYAEPMPVTFLFLSAQSPYPWGKIFKRSLLLLHRIRFQEEMSVGEDTLFCYRYLIHADKVAISHDILYHYKAEGGAWSNFSAGKRDASQYRSLYDICIQVLPLIQGVSEEQKESWYKEIFRQTFRLQSLLRTCKLPLILKMELECRGYVLAFKSARHLRRRDVLPQFRSVLRVYKSLVYSHIRKICHL